MNEMKKLFKNFDENSGWRSIERFVEYVENFESKKNYKMILKCVEEFKQSQCIKKDFVNFRRFCLGR